MFGFRDFPWTCEVCGVSEPTGATFEQSSSAWTGAKFVHRNPAECRANIQAELQKKDARIKELEAQIEAEAK